MNDRPKPFGRVVIRFAGRLLGGADGQIYCPKKIRHLITELKTLVGVEVLVVMGGSNIGKGSFFKSLGVDPQVADFMGMTSTAMNAMLLHSLLQKAFGESRQVVWMNKLVNTPGDLGEPLILGKLDRDLSEGRIVIVSGGIGSPGFNTDIAAVAHAYASRSQVVFMATDVNGIYDSDPKKNPAAIRIPRLTHRDYLKQRIGVMESPAVALAADHCLPIRVFDFSESGALLRACMGEDVGTIIITPMAVK